MVQKIKIFFVACHMYSYARVQYFLDIIFQIYIDFDKMNNNKINFCQYFSTLILCEIDTCVLIDLIFGQQIMWVGAEGENKLNSCQ